MARRLSPTSTMLSSDGSREIQIEHIEGSQLKADNTRKDSTKEFRVEVRTSDPPSPALGRIWFRSDL